MAWALLLLPPPPGGGTLLPVEVTRLPLAPPLPLPVLLLLGVALTGRLSWGAVRPERL